MRNFLGSAGGLSEAVRWSALASYNLTKTGVKPGQADARGVTIDHDFIERTTFVVGKDHKIIATLSSKDDGLSPGEHVKKSLAIVQQVESK